MTPCHWASGSQCLEWSVPSCSGSSSGSTGRRIFVIICLERDKGKMTETAVATVSPEHAAGHGHGGRR